MLSSDQTMLWVLQVATAVARTEELERELEAAVATRDEFVYHLSPHKQRPPLPLGSPAPKASQDQLRAALKVSCLQAAHSMCISCLEHMTDVHDIQHSLRGHRQELKMRPTVFVMEFHAAKESSSLRQLFGASTVIRTSWLDVLCSLTIIIVSKVHLSFSHVLTSRRVCVCVCAGSKVPCSGDGGAGSEGDCGS